MTDPKQNDSFDLADLSEFDLTPDWARSEPGNVSVRKPARQDARRTGGERSRRPDSGQRQRSSRDDRKGGYGRPSGPRPERRDSARPNRPHLSARTAPAPLKVSFLPERKGLGIVARRIRSTKKAFALPDIAALFLSKPEYYMLKVEVEEGRNLTLFQCTLCGEITQSIESAKEHVFDAHADNFFDIETVESEPPSGSFPCIAKCGVSRELIGPPNHHTYREKLLALHAAHCPDMPLPDYEKRIVTLTDEDALEEWKKMASIKTQYRPKGDADSDPIDAKSARSEIIEKYSAKMIKSGRRFVMPAKSAWNIRDEEIKTSLNSALNMEKKFPITLIHALRPALRHMNLHIFKIGPKKTFVSAFEPKPIDPKDSISPIKEGLQFIKDNPGCKRKDLTSAMAGGEHKSEEEIENIIKSIHWLVDCGHLTEFTDGSLLLPFHSH